MRTAQLTTLSLIIFALVFFVPHSTIASELYFAATVAPEAHIRFTNENWSVLPHPKIAWFARYADGSTSGMTENGIPFRQYEVPNDAGLHIERFEIEDHYHYIIDGVVIDGLANFSIALTSGGGVV